MIADTLDAGRHRDRAQAQGRGRVQRTSPRRRAFGTPPRSWPPATGCAGRSISWCRSAPRSRSRRRRRIPDRPTGRCRRHAHARIALAPPHSDRRADDGVCRRPGARSGAVVGRAEGVADARASPVRHDVDRRRPARRGMDRARLFARPQRSEGAPEFLQLDVAQHVGRPTPTAPSQRSLLMRREMAGVLREAIESICAIQRKCSRWTQVDRPRA